MARPNKLTRALKEGGQDLHTRIVDLVNRGGQKAAADALGVSQPTIGEWLKREGYIRVTRYVKEETA